MKISYWDENEVRHRAQPREMRRVKRANPTLSAIKPIGYKLNLAYYSSPKNALWDTIGTLWDNKQKLLPANDYMANPSA